MSGGGTSTGHSGYREAALKSAQDGADVLRALAGDKSYNALYREHFDVCNSQAAWYDWLTGRRVPRLSVSHRMVGNTLGHYEILEPLGAGV